MTLEVYDGPGTEDYRSTRYTATVAAATGGDATTAYVYGYAEPVGLTTDHWDYGAVVECSWFTFGTDADASVTVTCFDDQGNAVALETVTVYPLALGIEATITGGNTFSITLPENTKVFIWVNSVDEAPLMLFADGLKTAADDGVSAFIDYADTGSVATTTTAGETLYFGPGVHTIGQLFPCVSGSRIYIDGGAWVIGSFDLRTTGSDFIIEGPGVISGEWMYDADYPTPGVYTGNFYTHDLLKRGDRTFQQKLRFCTFLGWTSGEDFEFSTTRVRDVTVVDPCYYVAFWGVNHFTNMKAIGPWWENSDCFRTAPDTATGQGMVQSVVDCFCFNGDDGLVAQDNWGHRTWTNNFIVTTNGSGVLLCFYGYEDDDTSVTATDTYLYNIGPDYTSENIQSVGNAHIKCWVDTPNEEHGRFHVDMTGIYIDGFSNMLFSIEVMEYPYEGTTYSGIGQAAYFSFNDVTLEEIPEYRSRMMGVDWVSTPHDIAFNDVRIAGVELNVRNYSTYVDQNTYPYNISVGGRTMTTAVDICNTALGHLGDTAKITAIVPPDGSTQATLCARIYQQALETLLEMHTWNFATRREALVEIVEEEGSETGTEWQYVYEIPDDCLKALAVHPPEATDDYTVSFPASYPYDNAIMNISAAKVPQTFCIEQDAAGELRIFTNMEDAVLRYVAYVTDPNFFTPMFSLALSWHIASQLAGPIIKGAEGAAEAKRCVQMMMAFLAKAKESDSQQRMIRPQHTPPWMQR